MHGTRKIMELLARETLDCSKERLSVKSRLSGFQRETKTIKNWIRDHFCYSWAKNLVTLFPYPEKLRFK